MSWWDEWFRRWRRPYFRAFDEFEREMERMLREFDKEFDEFLKERRPLVWGWSLSRGPDGRPRFSQFGNLRAGLRPGVKAEREPLVDVFLEDESVKVTAELPGVEKEDIGLNATTRTLTISADTPQRKYYKEIDLPDEVEPETARATYKNGVLEVTFRRRGREPEGEPIRIE